MTFDGFTSVTFAPPNQGVSGFVYVWFFVDEVRGEVPFYVGQTKRIWGRLDDYYWAMFSAATDFKVGEAIRYLAERERPVILKYRQSLNPIADEWEIINALTGEGFDVLNDLRGYDYKTAHEEEERLRVRKSVDTMISAPPTQL